MSHLRIASVLIALCAITLPVNAFQNREPLAPSGFAIQITNQRGQSFHLLLSEGESKERSFTVSPYDIVKRADKDSEQVSEVYVAASAEGDAWKLKVWVVKGEFYDKGRQDLLTYVVRENEKVTVKEMEQFGIKPFDIAVVRVKPAAATQPEVRNRTESILVTNVEATVIPTPYRISLRNLSHKGVLALELNTYSGAQKLALKWPRGTWDHPLIEPGGDYTEGLWSAARGQTGADGWVPDQSTSIEISGVVFTDGTYEGSPYLAAVMKAEVVGGKAQLRRMLPLVQTAWESTDRTGEEKLTRLKESVSLLGEDIDPAQLKELIGQFPTLRDDERKNLGNFVRFGLNKVKSTFLKEMNALGIAGRPLSSRSAREWISKARDDCERWLSALKDQ